MSKILDFFFNPPKVEPDGPIPEPPAKGEATRITAHGAPERTEAEKIDFHIRRFTLALEQNTKGRARAIELRENLNYWLARKAAENLKVPE